MAKEDRVKVGDRDLPRDGADAFPGRNRTWHLDRDPNDPRRNPAPESGFSLNEDNPEKAPAPQNPVE